MKGAILFTALLFSLQGWTQDQSEASEKTKSLIELRAEKARMIKAQNFFNGKIKADDRSVLPSPVQNEEERKVEDSTIDEAFKE